MCFRKLVLVWLFFSMAACEGQIVVTFGDAGFEMEFVFIGDAGNSPDEADFRGDHWGDVSYPYQIAKYELRCDNIDDSSQCSGVDGPPTRMGLRHALEFVNLLNSDLGLPPAYQFDFSGQGRILKPWEPSDPEYAPTNPLRNTLSRFFLPTANEWYKAAYYDPESQGYFDYATGTNELRFVSENTVEEGVFVFDFTALTQQAGGLSPYGTMGQTGNVGEWHEPTVEPSLGGGWAGVGSALHDQIAARSHQVPGALNIGLRIVDLLIEDVVGDFNGDGLLTGTDIDLLSASIRAEPGDLAFDINMDGRLDSLDRIAWVEQIANTNFGDSDLNGDVSFRDFLTFANNFGEPTGWTGGDFDGSGVADFPDFLALANNFGINSSTEDVASVPEPSSLVCGGLGLLLLRRRRYGVS